MIDAVVDVFGGAWSLSTLDNKCLHFQEDSNSVKKVVYFENEFIVNLFLDEDFKSLGLLLMNCSKIINKDMKRRSGTRIQPC